MNARTARVLAWSLGVVALALTAVAIGLDAGSETPNPAWAILFVAIVTVFSVVGALIATRHPGNPIGWIFCGVAVASSVGSLAGGYAGYRLAGNDADQWLGRTAAWYANSSWIVYVVTPATFLLMLFPDGRLLSRRWRVVAWCGGVGIAGFFLTAGLQPGPLEDFPEVSNPYAVDSVVVDIAQGFSALLVLVALVGSPVSLVLRARRADFEQRQQIKWLAWAGSLAAATITIGTAGYDQLTPGVANVVILLSVLGLPVATGVAILRYRLYDIDLVINRTLVYGGLTVTLGAAYLGIVLLLQVVLSPLTQGSGLAVAGSTLAVAALFRPARRRIQAVVDRRFFRRKYDAARTLEAFGVRLREQLDLDALGFDLQLVVHDTMHPAHVSLWLRSPR